MSLKQQLFLDLKDAMKQKNNTKKDAIQMVRASILQLEKDSKNELSEEDVVDVIIKEIKKYKDVLPDFQKSGRQDLIDETQKKLDILKSYLPKQLTLQEIEEIVSCVINETSSSSIKDMGKVMSIVSNKTKGRADNKTVSEIIKKLLS